jgi:hypothetical protein
LLPAGNSWYRPPTMSPETAPFRHSLVRLAVCLLLAAGLGCGARSFWLREQEGPRLDLVKPSDLQPGCYCEIEMVVPPTAPAESFDCFKGTVKEVNHDEVVLTNVLEESCIEYGTSSRQKVNQQKRDLVRVPLTGVDAIWALPPGKSPAGPHPSSSASFPRGPQATQPTQSEGVSAAGSAGSSPSLNQRPQGAGMPAHFDAPPSVGQVVR